MTVSAHEQRIKDELKKAGMTAYGQFKMSSRHLPTVIKEDEHITGVVYGHTGIGLAMLVATDRRIIYLERRPLFTSMDDISYDMIAGVKYTDAGMFPSLTLYTRMGNYTLTYINPRCGGRFEKYIESRIENIPQNKAMPQPLAEEQLSEIPVPPEKLFSDEARKFLSSHEVAVLSTTDRTGSIQGVTIYYFLGTNNKIYIMTKTDTAKAHNMLANHQVALTIFEAEEAKTAQIQGYAEIEADPATKQAVFDQLLRPRKYGGETRMPPLSQLEAGGFIAFRITPITVKYTDYKRVDRILPTHRTS
nr:Rv1155_F420: PPOX class probable F420-dependent [uncultured bacterium]